MQHLRPRLNTLLALLLTPLAGNTAGQIPEPEEIPNYATVLAETSQHDPVRATSWLVDGATILSATREAVTAWSWHSGQELWRRTVLRGESDHFAISPTGTALAVDSGAALSVYRLPSGEAKTAQLDEGRISELTFASDETLLIGTTRGQLCLWLWTAESSLHCSKPHQLLVSSIVFDPVGLRVFSAAWNEIVETKLDLAKGTLGPEAARFYGSWGHLSALTISEDGSTLALGSAEGKIWNTTTGAISSTELVTAELTHVSALSFSPDGSVLASGDRGGRLDFWGVHSREHLLQLEGHPLPITGLAFAPSGKLIASASSDGSAKIWSFSSGELAQTLEGHSRRIIHTALGPNGNWLAVVTLAGELFIWDLEQGVETSRLTSLDLVDTQRGRAPSSLAIDSEATLVAVGFRNGDTQLIRLSTDALPHPFSSSSGVAIDALAFNASGTTLASGAHDGSISLWNIATGEKEPSTTGLERPILDLVFDTEARLNVLTAGGQLFRWNPSSSDEPAVITVEGKPTALTHHPTYGLLIAFDDGSFRLDPFFSSNGRAETTILGGRLRAPSYGGSRRTWVDGHRIIQVETLPSDRDWYSRTWSLLSGVRRQWAACDSAGRCRRQDDGSLLVALQDSIVHPLTPAGLQSLAAVEVDPSVKSLSVPDGESATVSVAVQNRGVETIHWLRLLQVDSNPSSPIVFKPSAALPSLPPGKDVTLDGRISVQSDYESPKSQNLVLQLQLHAANTGERIQISPIEIKTQVPSLAWRGAHWHRDESRLEIRLENIGKAELADSTATLQFFGATLEPRGISALPGNEEGVVSFVLPRDLDPEGESFDLVVETTTHPLHRWVFRNQRTKSWLQRWLIPVVLGNLVLAGFLLWHFRLRYTGHSLARLVQQPRELLELPADQLVEADRILQRLDELDPVLRQIDVRSACFKSAIEFLTTADPALRAQQLAEHLGVRLVKPTAENDRLWRLILGEDFRFNLNECVLRLPTSEATSAGILSDLSAQTETKSRITLVVLHDMEQQDVLSLQTGPENPWIAPTSRELTKLLLARNPLETLAEITARHVAATKISPYQVRQGIQKESMFFGRERVLSQILQGAPANYMVVGARQLGKSSLLHALKRRLADDPVTHCHLLVLNDNNLVGRLAQRFGIDKRKPMVTDLIRFLDRSSVRHLILVDEVDSFIQQDEKDAFRGLQLLRSLSEEGRLNFVLAGFWDLFSHAQRDYLSPLKNFGEIIRLGELEYDACERLVTVPMGHLGLRFAEHRLVERLIEATGQRPNLITIACHELIKHAGTERRLITAENLDKALHSPAIYDALEINKLGSGAGKLERIITYATVEQDEFSMADLVERLRSLGLKSDQSTIEQALGRLELACVLKPVGGAHFAYQVPLYREMLIEREPGRLLRDAIGIKDSRE